MQDEQGNDRASPFLEVFIDTFKTFACTETNTVQSVHQDVQNLEWIPAQFGIK